MGKLDGRTIAFLAADGVEQVELTEPWKAVEEAGGTPRLVSLEEGEIQGHEHLEKGATFEVDAAVSDVSAGDFDGLVLPGGVANPDFLRADGDAVAFVRAFVEQGKPIGAICHGPWTPGSSRAAGRMTCRRSATSWSRSCAKGATRRWRRAPAHPRRDMIAGWPATSA